MNKLFVVAPIVCVWRSEIYTVSLLVRQISRQGRAHARIQKVMLEGSKFDGVLCVCVCVCVCVFYLYIVDDGRDDLLTTKSRITKRHLNGASLAGQ